MKWSEFLQFTPDERKAVLALVLFTAGGGLILEVARRHPEWTPGIRVLAPPPGDSTAAGVDLSAGGAPAPGEAPGARRESGLLGGGVPPGAPPETAATVGPHPGEALPSGSPPHPAPPAPPGPVDLNRADLAALESLPGIGPAMARRIVEEREARGAFQRPEDLLRVKGIGPATLKRLRPFLAPLP